jgi:hypothetical protein
VSWREGLGYPQFSALFPEGSEIGRELTDDELLIYHDNGAECGIWRHDRRSTVGRGEILDQDKSACCRAWCKRLELKRSQERSR